MSDISYMEAALVELQSVLVERNRDYKIDSEFSNFEFAGSISGVETVDVILSQLSIKLGRIKGLRGKAPSENNQLALLDSYKDLAGYATILFAYALSFHVEDTETYRADVEARR